MSDLVLGRIQRLADAMARQPDASPDAVAPPTQPTIGQPAAPKADARSENGGKRLGLVEQIETAAKTEGLQAAEDVIAKHEAYLWSKLSQVAEPLDPAQSLTYAERAFERAPQASQASYARRVARLAHDVRDALPDDRVMQALLASGDAADVALAARLLNDGRVWRELAAAGFPMPKRRETPAFLPIPGKVLYCLHNSLPHDSGGYATRSHGVLQSVNRAGFSLVAYTRLGYPWDLARQAAKWRDFDGPAEDVIDGIVYRRLPTRTEGRRQLPIDRYLARYAEEFEAVVRRERPEILHAASAYLVGVPTAAVARRLGIPFVYEVRGLWEVTHVSRDPAWAESDQYAAYVRLETQAAQAADAVLTLTNGLKQELVRRGVPEQKIAVVPNSVDTDRFVALEPDRELARRLGVEGKRIVGYVGSFVDYEGLDDLLHAAAVVIDRGVDVRLLLVGDGAESSRLRDLVADLELTEHVIMPGRVPFEDVQRYYSLVDVAVFPRKPWPVTEMVSPMKPFEAMAMEKALLVSSVDALTEIVADGETGVVFAKGDIDSLADALERMVRDPALCRRLGTNARAWVVANRRWEQAAATIRDVYRTVQQPIPLPDLVASPGFDPALWDRLHSPREQARQAAILAYPWHGRVLDLGTRHGYVAAQVARAHCPDLIVGLDPETPWPDRARRLAAANDLAGVSMVVARGERLPFPSQSFDGVIATQVLEHIERPDAVLREVARVLKPDGSLLVAVPGYGEYPPGTVEGHVQDFTVADMRQLLERAGFETIEHHTVGPREFHFARPAAKRLLAAD